MKGDYFMSKFIEVKPEEFNESPFKLIGTDWMLITAENGGKVNTMTASWGGFGVMWNKNVAYIVIRPQRYTKEFVDNSETFSLTFFDDEKRTMLSYLGTASGRDEDKVKKSNLTVIHTDNVPYFEESTKVVLCKKLFAQEYTSESFIDQSIKEKNYPNSDYHTLYIAEVTKILIKE